VGGGINFLGNMFNYNGPMQIMYNFTYDNETSEAQVLEAIDSVMDQLAQGVTQEMLDKALVKMRSSLYDELGGQFGLGRADLLCSFALFDDDPARINSLEDEFKKVTPEVVNKTIAEYFRKTNRTVLTVNPLLADNETAKP
jgi:predicted Zn-dependent peptidase